MNRQVLCATATLALAAGMACGQARIWQDDIRREEVGTTRRDKLTKMELQAAPADLFSTLAAWTGGPALTSDAMKGKAVLVVTFASWEPNSIKVFDRAVRVAEANAEKGLLVLAVHGEKNWDDAVKLATEKGFKGMLAKDDGKFRAKLLVDGDPDLYLIDRAGQIRFADFETDSLSKAIERVVTESADQAADQPKQFRALLAKEKSEFERPGTASAVLKKAVEFTLPDASAYSKAPWPEKNKDQNNLGANDIQEQKLPNAEAFGQKEIWLTEKPDWNGKVILIDFWATWCAPCKKAMPLLDDLAKTWKKDLVIIGNTGATEDQKTVERFLRAKNELAYYHTFDDREKDTLYKAVGVRAIPHCVIVSTDGTVRWQGNPLASNFRNVVELIIAVDPGVQARRKAEELALKAQQGQ